MIRTLLALLLLSAAAQARELKIATWNLEWLTLRPAGDPDLPAEVVPKRDEDRARLRQYALALDADVVALEEVDGPDAAATLFPPERYTLWFAHDHVVQRVGFAVRRGLAVQQNADLTGLDVTHGARHALRSGADITLLLPGLQLRLLAVHLKAGCQRATLTNGGRSCETLRAQLPTLQGWVAERQADGRPFVLLGDFNRQMDAPEEMQAALDRAAPLLRVNAGMGTPCWGGSSFIDHIFLGGAAQQWLVPHSTRVMVYREGVDAKERLSDHCPVSIKLRLPD